MKVKYSIKPQFKVGSRVKLNVEEMEKFLATSEWASSERAWLDMDGIKEGIVYTVSEVEKSGIVLNDGLYIHPKVWFDICE